MSVKPVRIAKGISLFEIENNNKMRLQVSTYGARIHKILVEDKKGNFIDVVAGFENAEDFMGDNPYFNAVIGRVANRIGGARFTLNGKEYLLFKNDGKNSLHGGKEGFDRKIWTAEIVDENAVKMNYFSPDGEESYPGNLTVSVTYRLTDENEVRIEYEAVSDKDTICSLTNHAYFNLDGDFRTVLDHEVFIASDKITTIDETLIPHGDFTSIKGTAYDFSVQKKIGKDIKTDDFMLNIARGYDFNYVLNNDGKSPVASAYSNKSGIRMEVFTDRPCMQLYTGNFLDGLQGKKTYGYQSAFCMETQGYPNACNVPSFPSMTLKKGERYFARTSYKFSVKK
ncbi:MAG: galactose mutarotase [Clostridia bacterium]|nr:galactose mutarotase [Clostridia bacterium]